MAIYLLRLADELDDLPAAVQAKLTRYADRFPSR